MKTETQKIVDEIYPDNVELRDKLSDKIQKIKDAEFMNGLTFGLWIVLALVLVMCFICKIYNL